MQISSQTPMSARATQLLRELPANGTGQTRRQQAQEALDTLVREYPQTPEVEVARLTRAMGRRASIDAVAEQVFRTGLQASAEGLPGAGPSLAALALKVADAVPASERHQMIEGGYAQLKNNLELQSTMKLGPAVSGWDFPRSWTFSSEEIEGAHEILLDGAAHETPPEATAGLLLGNLLTTGTENLCYRSGTLARRVLHATASGASGEERRTYDVAQAALGYPLLGEGWSGAGAVGLAFLQALPHTLEGRCERLLDMAGPGWRSDFRTSQGALMRGVKALIEEARDQGNPGWKLLAAARDTEQIGALRVGLEQVAEGRADASGQGLAGFAGKVLAGDSSWDTAWTLSSSLAKRAPDSTWSAAFRLTGEGPRQMRQVMEALSHVQGSQSPLRVAAGSFGQALQSDPGELARVWAVAESLAQAPADVEVLRQARETLRAQGAGPANQFLAQHLEG